MCVHLCAMPLAHQVVNRVFQVDPDEILKTLHDHPSEAHKRHIHSNRAVSQTTPYSSRYASQQEISKFRIPHEGAPADAVHQMLKDELDLDGRPNLNLARYIKQSFLMYLMIN